MYESIAKGKKWGKKMSGNYDHFNALRGEGPGSPTPNGKKHLKFPF